MRQKFCVSRCCCVSPATCAFCETGVGPQQWQLTIGGVVPVYSNPGGDGISDADLDAIVSQINATHDIPYSSDCVWLHEFSVNGEAGNVYDVRIRVLMTDSTFPTIPATKNGFVVELKVDDEGELDAGAPNTSNTQLYWGTRAYWDKEINDTDTFDCTVSQLTTFDSQAFDLLQNGRGYVDASGVASITVNPV